MEMEDSLPLHLCHVQKFSIIINRSHAFLHCVAIALLIYYRVSFLFQEAETRAAPLLPWLLVFTGELVLSYMWVLSQAYRWRPVYRSVFPERLPKDDSKFPDIDVFICTADPKKEPTVEVMSTVLSAMALDYPPEKLHVYLSDDGVASVTLTGMKEAFKFARSWLPFCKKYGIKTICPKAYFSGSGDQDGDSGSPEFMEEKQKNKEKYDLFKERVLRATEKRHIEDQKAQISTGVHPPMIQVINEECDEATEEQIKMPLLVYVSREKRPSHPHHFKAGALNVLLRVSGVISNSPYILVLDCDMYCNDPTSARQAVCFHFDPKISPSLAFVQFPQIFHNLRKNDIYDSEIRSIFRICWQGLDGLQGPVLSGTNFYIKREALYGTSLQKGLDLIDLKNSFGQSNEFLKSLRTDHKPSIDYDSDISSSKFLQETRVLASCAYEENSKWGEEVGFMYYSLVEDYFTGFKRIHCNGWKSVYLDPPRPQFLGTSTTNLNDFLIQGTRWCSGLAQVLISKFNPLIYGLPRMSLLESMGYAELASFPIYFFPLWCLATIPQLCLLNGIPLYPEVSNPKFYIFLFIFLSALSKHLYEVLITGGSIRIWRNEQRIWMIKGVTSYFYGTLNAVMSTLGLAEAKFVPTNKADDSKQAKRYHMGIFDFQTSTVFLAPLVTLTILNILAFFWGLVRGISTGDWEKTFAQVLLSFYILIMGSAVIEGMIVRKDTGRIPPSVTGLSALFCVVFLFLGSIFLMY
ncbi:cellulose synthase-like protein G2 [Mangifera indica]|uniref:cellulose synthase-like protein G2 n=1 Tax=Mangifera indica TaxID=29780 RepID=UPI001CFC1E6E|nr:cellulose synthase-like protein G2 [Mangifera indica]